jgi:hypothetical protein
MNILDLGLFRALQSVQQANPSNTKDELIAVVQETFKNPPSRNARRSGHDDKDWY